jgi:SAM-dependent methyltransferase
MSRGEEARRFYEAAYSKGIDGETHGRWRDLTAIPKAEHVIELARAAGLQVSSIAEIGCGDGAVLERLSTRRFGRERVGYDIVETAVALAARRTGVTEAILFDGRTIPAPAGAYDLAIASHVIEHVPSPSTLLGEMARIARAVVIEVPLEANLAAARPSARALAREAGHIQTFDRADVKDLIAAAGLEIQAELRDTQPLSVHLFAHKSPVGVLTGYAKWVAKRAIAHVPVMAERLVTFHYAVAAVPRQPSDPAVKDITATRVCGSRS